MNIGIMIGAVLAAGLAGRYGPVWRIPWRPWLAATCGGFLQGYGARLAFVSNVGAYFSGFVSTSLHGWVCVRVLPVVVEDRSHDRLPMDLGARSNFARPAKSRPNSSP